MIFKIMLACTVLFGGGLAVAISRVPGRRLRPVLSWLGISLVSCGLFQLALACIADSRDVLRILNACFSNRFAKLTGCFVLLMLLVLFGLLLRLVRGLFSRTKARRAGKYTVPAIFACFLLLAAGFRMLAGQSLHASVRLSEVCCANFKLYYDPLIRDYPDYVELSNTGGLAEDLTGYCLTDKPDRSERFPLPSVRLEPGQLLLLIADGSGVPAHTQDGTPRLSFSLKPGETVCLLSPTGELIDSVTLPGRHKNIAMTLLDGAWVQAVGTPGESNDGAQIYMPATLEAPRFSLPSGFYGEPQTLMIEASEGCEIRYTMDGSVPTANSLLYTEALMLTDISGEPNRVLSQPNTTTDRSGAVIEPVKKGTLIRAAAFREGERSEAVSAVYYIGDFSEYEGMAVLNLVADPDDLFGELGIAVTGPAFDAWLASGGEGEAPAVNFYGHGRDWEREAEIMLWDENGAEILNSPCGVRVQGGSGRDRAVKRFSFYARSVYGTGSVFDAAIFAVSPTHSFFCREQDADAMAQALTVELGLGGLDARPAAIFINGEYYSKVYLRERYDARYFETHFGVSRDSLAVISNNALDIGTEADYADYCGLMDLIQNHDCADPSVYAAVCEQMDVESYASWMASYLYLNNTDWSPNHNLWVWRAPSDDEASFSDGRWRWLVYDMDACFWKQTAVFGDAPRASYNVFEFPLHYNKQPIREAPMLSDLLSNPDFRQLFIQRWLEYMNVSLTYERALPLLERFGLTESDFWPEFLQERPRYAIGILNRELAPDAVPCTLTLRVSDPLGGSVLLNTVTPDLTGEAWTGTWLTGIPVTLTAEPADGWVFVGWEGDCVTDQAAVTLVPDGNGLNLTAVFQRK